MIRKNSALEQAGNICSRFIWYVSQQPDAVAIHHHGKSISYAELDKLSHALAMSILDRVNASQSTNSDQVIAIHGKRNANLIVSMIACARANLTFAVLDAAYPDSRIQQMLDLIQPQLIIGTDNEHNDFLALQRALGKYSVHLPRDTQKLAEKLSQQAESERQLNRIAYLLFTSGTTGVPKCIKTSHAPLVHFVDWYIETFHVERDAQFSLLSGLGHDPILRDIFVPLSAGATINIPEQSIVINPVSLFDWFQSRKISYTHATPPLLKILCSATNQASRLPNLKYVFSGGDALKVNQIQKLKSLNGDCQIVNFYGTTETPQAMAYYRVANDDSDPIAIGYPISDVHLHLLNDDLTHTKMGEIGQIAIETTYLSEGYLHDEAMTNGRFVHVPNAQDKVYLTGDYGTLREDGAMLLKGRVDDQIKIRGFRIELGEIVTALESLAYVQTAVVLPKKADNGENYLIAYLVREPSAKTTNGNVADEGNFEDIKLAIAKLIPSYMVPNFYLWIDRLPLLPNGKLDRAQLPDLHQGDLGASVQVIEGSIEDSIIKQWKGLLGIADINPRKSFIELGGDSLSFIQASLSIENVMGWIPDEWEKKSISELAQLPIKKSSLISVIETPLFFRAVSIVLIVMTHFTSIHISATHALFFISGISLGKFQLNQILTMADFSPMLKTIGKIALPTFVFILAIQLRHIDDIDLFNLLLIGNFQTVYGEIRHFWFIEVLLQCYIIIALIFSISRVRHQFLADPFFLSIAASVLSLVLSTIVSAHFFDPANVGAAGAAFNPISRLWLMFLGIALVHANTFQKKMITFLTAVICFIASTISEPYMMEVNQYLFSVTAILMIVFVNKLPIPKASSTLIRLVASASMFIYLSHFTLGGHLDFYPFRHFVPKIVAMLIAGILIQASWDRMVNFAMTTYAKVASKKSES